MNEACRISLKNSERKGNKINKNFFKVAVIFLVFYLIIAGLYFKRIYQPWGIADSDFTVFTRAAQDLAQKKDIYANSYLETGRDYYKYSPFFAWAMIPLSKLHKHLSVPIWYFSIYLFFMAAIFSVRKPLTTSAPQKVLSKTFYFLAILMSLRFLLSVVQRVQSDCLVLFLLSLFILALCYNKELWAGIALASAAMVKLTPLIFLPYLLLRKRFKAALSSGAAILFYLLAPAFYVGMQKNLFYLKNWFRVHQTNPADYIIWYKNQSLLSCLSRFLTQDSTVGWFDLSRLTVWVIFAVFALTMFALIFLLSGKNKSAKTEIAFLTEISLVIICMILLSPLAWKHTFVHLLIPHLVLIYYAIYIRPADKVTRVLLIISFFFNSVLNPELTRTLARTIQLYSSVTWGTLILYFALLRLRRLAPDTKL